MKCSNTVIIAAGGTGGHLYPGIALARELKKRGNEPLFVVRRNDACREILEKEGFHYREIPVAGMPRGLSLRLFTFAYLQIKSLRASRALVKEIRPMVIIGMGGYISFPVAVAGKTAGVPVVIHEQNYIPGLANKMLSRFVDAVAVSFEDSVRFFPKGKTVVTGNPVREELFRTPHQDVFEEFHLIKGRFTVLVFGGSQGASIINRTLVAAFPLLQSIKERIQFLHITGKRDCPEMEQAYAAAGIKGCVLPYLHNIGDAYAAADLIVCRSGATTVAELKILNKPSLLIPYLHATANHQEFNAQILVKAGLGTMIREKDLTPEKLAESIVSRSISCQGQGRPAAMQMPAILPQQALCDLVLRGGNAGIPAA